MKGYEKRNINIDLLKHITTLSIGTLAIFASFLTQIKNLSNYSNYISIIVITFAVSIIGSIICILAVLGEIEKPPYQYSGSRRFIFYSTYFFSIVGFFTGVVSIALLILSNV